MSKFLLILLVQISKALVYSKIQFLIRKVFFQLSAQLAQRPAGPTSRLLLPLTLDQSVQAATTGQPCAAPMVSLDYLHQRENNFRITPPSFPH
jgi:hypothetical protein